MRTAAGRFEMHLFHSRERCLAFERRLCPTAEMRDHARAQTDAFVRDDGFMVMVVWLDAALDDFDSISMLAHESVHVKQYVLDHLGEDEPAHEEEAYVTQAAFEALMTAHATWREKHGKGE
ncbi:MAG: hypothetical protein LKF44_08320 [Atopobiaceae bacterium]|jgi:hypothetical protein|nr:hypothetical protein [Atopobiaceae bacterium]